MLRRSMRDGRRIRASALRRTLSFQVARQGARAVLALVSRNTSQSAIMQVNLGRSEARRHKDDECRTTTGGSRCGVATAFS